MQLLVYWLLQDGRYSHGLQAKKKDRDSAQLEEVLDVGICSD